jgi:hypothetical protein
MKTDDRKLHVFDQIVILNFGQPGVWIRILLCQRPGSGLEESDSQHSHESKESSLKKANFFYFFFQIYVRMKCTITDRGRMINLKQANYKVQQGAAILFCDSEE